MTRPGLTSSEKAVFDVIRTELVAGRPAPTYDEITERLGLASKGHIYRKVGILVEKGYVTRQAGHYRTIALTPDAETYTVHLPPDLDACLGAHVSSRGATPQGVIVKAVAEYLARQP